MDKDKGAWSVLSTMCLICLFSWTIYGSYHVWQDMRHPSNEQSRSLETIQPETIPLVRPYRHMVTVIRVVDGDTLDVKISLGFRTFTEQRLRLLRVDTPEIRGGNEEERKKAIEVKAWVISVLMTVGTVVEIEATNQDSFGRYLSEVWYRPIGGSWINLGDELLTKGYAVKR